MRVALYVRVSTDEQARHGLSLGDQLDALRAYARAHSHAIVGEYTDAGISARKPYTKRPALLRLLDDCKSGKIDVILFVKLDRWFRNVGSYYAVQDLLDAYHVSWKAILEDYETITASGRLKVNIMLSVAQDEADRTSERIKFTVSAKKARGESTNGRVPLGYCIKDKRPAIDPDTADAARDMFSAYIRLRSVPAVRRYMMQHYGISRAYQNWGRMLANPIYKGQYFGTDCPALISADDWDLVQQIKDIRATRSTRPNRVYLFSGILRCAECGGRMATDTIIKGGKEYVYYRCANQMRGGNCDRRKRVREDFLEAWILQVIIPEAEKVNAQFEPRQKSGKNRIAKIKKRMRKLKDLYLSDLIERDEYETEYIALRDELRALESANNDQRPIDIPTLKSALELYNGLSKSGKKELWSRTIKEIQSDAQGNFFIRLF